ncbi:MAG: DUF2752 domain-containing protein [Phycisphaerales bacterium]|nr:MAG: DUF2752 domain-containing protein [Phycisphaerales bacterium]
MKIELVGVRRWPLWPLWAVMLVLVWFALGGVTICLSAHLGREVHLCLFKYFTGYPCPTCGFTRGLLAGARGQFIQAWLYNPLLFSLLGLYSGAMVVRILFRRGVRIRLTPAERATTWCGAAVLFAANWVYVILYVG